MPVPGDVLPSGHRLARRLPVPGGGWLVVHPGIPARTWVLVPASTRRHHWAHRLRAAPLERIVWAEGGGELYNFDGGRLLADHVVPWPIEEVARLAADLRVMLRGASATEQIDLAFESTLWFPRRRRIEVLPSLEVKPQSSIPFEVARLVERALPPGHAAVHASLEALRNERIGIDAALEAVVKSAEGRVPGLPATLAGFSLTGPRREVNTDAIGWAAREDGATIAAVVHASGWAADSKRAAAAAIGAVRDAVTGGRPLAREAWMDAAMTQAERAVSEANAEGKGTGVTMAAALLVPPEGSRWGRYPVSIAHVGAVRAYRLHDRVLTALTVDHTVVAEQVARGKLTAAEALTSRHRHIFTRSLGAAGSPPPEHAETVLDGYLDRLLLCTEGVWQNVPETELRAALSTWDLRKGARRLLAAVLDAEPDGNASAVLIGRG